MNNQAKMQVKLIDYASAPLEKLYAAFRTCYSADTPIEIWEKIEAEKISHDKIREFITERLKTGHASPLEQVVFWFGISGVSRSLSHQFVRHRIGISFGNFVQVLGALFSVVLLLRLPDLDVAHILDRMAQGLEPRLQSGNA